MFEVNALSCQHISIALEHPFLETMATIELDLTNIVNIKCSIYSVSANYADIAVKLSKIIQTCVSIPVTLRALIKVWEHENQSGLPRSLENGNFNLQLGPSDPGGRNANFGCVAVTKQEGDREFNGNEHSMVGGNNGNRAMFPQPGGIVSASGNEAENAGGIEPKPFVDHSMFESGDVNFIQMNSGNGSAGGNGSVGVPSNTSAMDIAYGSGGNSKINKRRRTEDFWKSPKSDLTNSVDVIVEQSSNHSKSDSNSLGVPMTSSSKMQVSEEGVARPAISAVESKTKEPILSVDVTKLDASANKSSAYAQNCDKSAIKSDAHESGEPAKKRAKRKEEKALDGMDGRSNLSPSVSITPITTLSSSSTSSSFNSVLTGLERRPGIEIIPISTTPAQSIKSSITITPISSSSKSGSSSDKRSMSSSGSHSSITSSKKFDDRPKIDKKKKRKRDEGPMGPPEKMPFKQDPLSRPVTVSIKTTDGAPVSPSGLLRKFTTSPIPSSSGKLSLSSSSSKLSPKQSPHHHGLSMGNISNHTSPKQPGLPSPKSGQYATSSPKHGGGGGSSSSSGKPSMSALKSAAISPNSKGGMSSSVGSSSNERSKSSSSSMGSGRDRDKDRGDRGDRGEREHRDRSLKYSGRSNSPKLKSSTVKLKQIDLNSAFIPVDMLLDPSTSNQDLLKLASGLATKNRKGSLSAVIDKLKSAHNVSEESPPSTPTIPSSHQMSDLSITPTTGSSSSSGSNTLGKDKISMSICTTNSGSSSGLAAALKTSSEYMVKHSSDMKITINKTRTKDSTSPSGKHHYGTSGSSSGSNSPKTHTGLKPGVNSGPASKKPQAAQNPSGMGSVTTTISLTSSSSGKSSSSSTKSMISKSSSSGSLGSSIKSSMSSTGGTALQKSFSSSHAASGDTFKKEKSRISSSSGSKSNSGKLLLFLVLWKFCVKIRCNHCLFQVVDLII